MIYAKKKTDAYPNLHHGRYEVERVICNYYVKFVGDNRRYDIKEFLFYRDGKRINKEYLLMNERDKETWEKMQSKKQMQE